MPEREYDKLEQFFRKAAAKADVTFNEDDWKKLETRLDAGEGDDVVAGNLRTRTATTTVIALVVLLSTTLWVSSDHDMSIRKDMTTEAANYDKSKSHTTLPESSVELPAPSADKDVNGQANSEGQSEHGNDSEAMPDTGNRLSGVAHDQRRPTRVDQTEPGNGHAKLQQENGVVKENSRKIATDAGDAMTTDGLLSGTDEDQLLAQTDDQTLQMTSEDLQEIEDPDKSMERNKQKAVVELPGAEEEETREVPAMVQEEHASDNKKHVAAPRLSLLLSFAPDFSGTSMRLRSSPGKAFGAILHYHPFERWSVSAGAVKNYKVYTGAGEDYSPPKNYWKYYTNGIIPETIDGSCAIIELPLMVQYTMIQTPKARWNVAFGASSYLMQSESYKYNFSQPNPGARERWDSRRSSRFMFNMLNFTIGFERQIAPGLMLGLEPYVKIPLEEIGWSNLKLYSSGASFTLRYNILQRKNAIGPTRSRGPD